MVNDALRFTSFQAVQSRLKSIFFKSTKHVSLDLHKGGGQNMQNLKLNSVLSCSGGTFIL